MSYSHWNILSRQIYKRYKYQYWCPVLVKHIISVNNPLYKVQIPNILLRGFKLSYFQSNICVVCLWWLGYFCRTISYWKEPMWSSIVMYKLIKSFLCSTSFDLVEGGSNEIKLSILYIYRKKTQFYWWSKHII